MCVHKVRKLGTSTSQRRVSGRMGECVPCMDDVMRRALEQCESRSSASASAIVTLTNVSLCRSRKEEFFLVIVIRCTKQIYGHAHRPTNTHADEPIDNDSFVWLKKATILFWSHRMREHSEKIRLESTPFGSMKFAF